jgi:hypothetical protein
MARVITNAPAVLLPLPALGLDDPRRYLKPAPAGPPQEGAR